MRPVMATERRNKPTEAASTTMPTTADAIYRAAAMLAPILPEGFYGTVTLFYEAGRPLRMKKEESIKL